MRPRLLDALDRAGDGRPRAAGFARERHQRRGIAQRRAVVGAAEQLGLRRRLDVGERRGVDALGAGAVAEQAERRGDLRLGDRRGEVGELGVGEIAQIAERRDAVARQHVERIGEIAAAVLRRLRRGGDDVAQPVERELERRVRHRKAALARPRQEVGDVGVEPGVVAADAPQAERAVRRLARQQPVDGVADALVDGVVEREMRLARKLVDIEQRQRAAGDLLGAAERIAVERLQQRRGVERGRRPDRERDRAGARHEIGEQIVRQRQALALGDRLHRAARQHLRRRLDRQARSCARARSRRAR